MSTRVESLTGAPALAGTHHDRRDVAPVATVDSRVVAVGLVPLDDHLSTLPYQAVDWTAGMNDDRKASPC